MAMENPGIDDGELRRMIQDLVVEVLRHKKITVTPEAVKEGVSLTRDLGLDSLDALQLSATVEKRYKLKFSDEDIRAMDDLGSIMRVVRKQVPPAP